MVETKVPKDIRNFKGKVLGPFSFRQIVCIAIAIVVDFAVYIFFLKNSGVSSDFKIMTLMFCATPILMFLTRSAPPLSHPARRKPAAAHPRTTAILFLFIRSSY